MSTPKHRNPYVGTGADGARRSAEIDRSEADGLDKSDPRHAACLESAKRWDAQAAALDKGKGRPTRRRTQALREQRTLRERLSVWREGRRDAARERITKARKAASKSRGSRGVDRVPDRYRVSPAPATFVVEHTDEPYRMRRARSSRYHTMRPGTNRPYVNPARDNKPGARLRKDVRP